MTTQSPQKTRRQQKLRINHDRLLVHDGIDDFTSFPIPHPALDFSGSFAISAIINPTDIHPNATVGSIVFCGEPLGALKFNFRYTNGSNQLEFFVGTDMGTVTVPVTTLEGDRLSHVMAVWDQVGEEARVYVNSALANKQSSAIGAVLNNTALMETQIGGNAQSGASVQKYSGIISHVVIVAAVPNELEISSWFRNGGVVPSSLHPFVVGHYPFTEKSYFKADAAFIAKHTHLALNDQVLADVGEQYNYVKKSGGILSFADAGGGNVTVTTSTAHTLNNGERVNITDTTNYNGTYIISNASGSVYDIVATFAGTETGNWNQFTSPVHGKLNGYTDNVLGILNRSEQISIYDVYTKRLSNHAALNVQNVIRAVGPNSYDLILPAGSDFTLITQVYIDDLSTARKIFGVGYSPDVSIEYASNAINLLLRDVPLGQLPSVTISDIHKPGFYTIGASYDDVLDETILVVIFPNGVRRQDTGVTTTAWTYFGPAPSLSRVVIGSGTVGTQPRAEYVSKGAIYNQKINLDNLDHGFDLNFDVVTPFDFYNIDGIGTDNIIDLGSQSQNLSLVSPVGNVYVGKNLMPQLSKALRMDGVSTEINTRNNFDVDSDSGLTIIADLIQLNDSALSMICEKITPNTFQYYFNNSTQVSTSTGSPIDVTHSDSLPREFINSWGLTYRPLSGGANKGLQHFYNGNILAPENNSVGYNNFDSIGTILKIFASTIGQRLDGYLIGFFVYNRVLSRKEMVAHYNNALYDGVSTKGLQLAYIPLDNAFSEDGSNVIIKNYAPDSEIVPTTANPSGLASVWDGNVLGFTGGTTADQLADLLTNLVTIDSLR